jgi:hypothetical protein
VAALTSGREGKEVAGGEVKTETEVVLRTALELRLDVTSRAEVVDAEEVMDTTTTGEGDMEETVITKGVSEAVD